MECEAWSRTSKRSDVCMLTTLAVHGIYDIVTARDVKHLGHFIKDLVVQPSKYVFENPKILFQKTAIPVRRSTSGDR